MFPYISVHHWFGVSKVHGASPEIRVGYSYIHYTCISFTRLGNGVGALQKTTLLVWRFIWRHNSQWWAQQPLMGHNRQYWAQQPVLGTTATKPSELSGRITSTTQWSTQYCIQYPHGTGLSQRAPWFSAMDCIFKVSIVLYYYCVKYITDITSES